MDMLFKVSPAVFLLVGFAISGYFYLTGSNVKADYKVKISSARSEIVIKENEIQKAKSIKEEAPMHEQEIVVKNKVLGAAYNMMPKELKANDVLSEISNEAKAAGVRLSMLRPSREVANERYKEMEMDIELEGTYTRLTLFMFFVSRLEHLVHLRNIKLIPKEIVDGQASLVFKGKLVAFKLSGEKTQ